MLEFIATSQPSHLHCNTCRRVQATFMRFLSISSEEPMKKWQGVHRNCINK